MTRSTERPVHTAAAFEGPTDDELAALLSLMSLEGMGPNRLRALTSSVPPTEVVAALRQHRLPSMIGGEPPSLPASVAATWFRDIGSAVTSIDLDAHRSGGHMIVAPGHPRWPFADDPDPPSLIFARGDLELLQAGPNVAVVGTRRCTSIGRQVASRLGAELVPLGVGVVSGLALGIDAAAHRGALAAGGRAIGVVASGLDVVYPASNRDLWEEVAEKGLLLSEVPLGQRPTRWRFPARNRLIAALSDLVVVVESHERGGALNTVDEATARGITVGAVPGSTLSPASDGTNALLFDGAVPIRHAVDAHAALDHPVTTPGARRTAPAASHRPRADHRTAPRPAMLDSVDEHRIIEAVRGGAVHLDRLIELLDESPPVVGRMVDDLARRSLLDVRGHVVALPESGETGPGSTRG